MSEVRASAVLAHVAVTTLGEAPAKWMLFLHGILGSKANWRSIARRFVAARPAWGALLVDLRMHGNSQGFTPPHDVASAAHDLNAVAERAGAPVRAVLGHSFGGKVALEFARTRDDLEQIWVIDSAPGARPSRRGSEGTVAVVRALAEMGKRFETREAFVERVVEQGFGRDLAAFLAMNLVRDESAFRLELDIGAIEQMLEDYFARDAWSVVAHPPGRAELHVVVAGRSNVLDEDDKIRLADIAAHEARVHVHTLEGAGHWVHADDPDGLVTLLVQNVA